jgi:two-component system NtrC family sensor kinase
MTTPLTEARILIVDDEPANVRLLERLLQQAGYRHLASTTDPRRVVALFTESRPDLVLLDLLMPHLDGVGVMEALRPLIPPLAFLPIVVLTADVTPAARQRALSAGAKDFVTKPLDHAEVLLRVKNLLETAFLYRELERHSQELEETVRQRSEQLLQAEKLATMGQLLAGVAHELNNPLSVLLGQAALLRQQLTEGPLASRAEKITAAAERCARIVRNFLALARQRPPERQETRLNQVVREAVELLAYQLRTDSVEVVLELEEHLPPTWADPHQLHQVLVNLIGNAHHAMRERPQPRRLTIRTALRGPAGRAALEVEDTGGGVPPEIERRIFEPFFTTKPLGVGTGLGLSLCQGMVESHGGRLTLRNAPGRGATFVVEVPVQGPAAAPARPEAEAAPSPPGFAGRRVLVVDDEREIGSLLADVLNLDGHQVEIAENGREALDRLAAGPWDLVLTDVRMPDMDGFDLYREIERRYPALARRVVFVTGDVLSADSRAFLESSGLPTLGKPFAFDDVLGVVRRALQGRGTGQGEPGTRR